MEIFLCLISIHPMLRFNAVKEVLVESGLRFQYILCYGSTHTKFLSYLYLLNFNTSYVTVQQPAIKLSEIKKHNFNTSYVTVQLKHLKQILCSCTISIHPMLRFNKKCYEFFCNEFGFQYILCYGSTP